MPFVYTLIPIVQLHMRFSTTFILVASEVYTVAASGPVDCSRGDTQCIALFGGESHCKYWQSSPVCHGSSTPCNCDGTLPVVPTGSGAESVTPVTNTVVEPPQPAQRRRRVFPVNNVADPAPAHTDRAPMDVSDSNSVPTNMTPQVTQRQRRVFVVGGGSNTAPNTATSVSRPVVSSLPQVEIPQGLTHEVAGVRTAVEQYVLRRTSEQAMFNQVIDRMDRVKREISSLTFDEAFEQLGGNRLLDFVAQAGERRPGGLLQYSPESVATIISTAIMQAVAQPAVTSARFQQEICTSKIQLLRNIVRGYILPESLYHDTVYRSTFAAGWVRACPTLQDDPDIARSIMLHGFRRYKTQVCSSGTTTCHGMSIATSRESVLDDAYGLLGAPGNIGDGLLRSILGGVRRADLGETGHGPGVIREWFTVVAEKLFGFEYGLFERSFASPFYTKISTLAKIADPIGSMSWYRMVGRFMALSITQGNPVGVEFPMYYFALMSGNAVTLDMIREDEPLLYNSLQNILQMDDDVLQSIGTGLEGSGYEDIDLTPGNRMMQIQGRLANMIQRPDDVREQMGAIQEGFFEVLPREIFEGFGPVQFRSFIVGADDVDIDDLSLNILPESGYTRSSAPIVNFLDALRDMTQPERRQILRYITGSSRVPLGGFKNLYPNRMRISPLAGGTDAHLAGAHTCFNHIELPPYSSRAIALQQLRKTLRANPDMRMHIA